MSIFADCLAASVKDGKISQKTSDEYQRYVADAVKEAEQAGKGPNAAHIDALAKGAERMMAEVGVRKTDAAREIVRLSTLIEQAKSNKISINRGLEGILNESVRGGTDINLINQQHAAYGIMQSRLTDFISELRSKNFGLTRDVAPAKLTAMELMGRDSGSASAKVNAEGWKKVLGWWRDTMEEEGIRIRDLDGYFLTQSYDALKVRAEGVERFVSSYMDGWRNGGISMRDFKSTSNAVLDPSKPGDVARVEEILRGAYENIRTHGDASIEPGITETLSMADRYNRRRVFEYKTFEAYTEFQERFGHGMDNLGDQFMRQMHTMASDLGMARTLGRDPDRTAKTLLQWGAKNEVDKLNLNIIDAGYFHASGKAAAPVNVTLANTAGALRSWLTSVQLPMAALGSVPDFAFLGSTAMWRGLPVMRMFGRYLEEMKGDGKAAMRAGLINQEGIRGLRDIFDSAIGENAGQGAKGLTGFDKLEAASGGAARVAGKAADFVMRSTVLSKHSASGRAALGWDFLGTLAEHADKPLDSVPARLQGFLKDNGITAGQWDILRDKAMHGERLFMDPAYLGWSGNKAEKEAAFKLLGAVDAELKFGIPEGSVNTRALLQGSTQAGTIWGESLRATQYKGFTMSVAQFQGWRMWDSLFHPDGTMPRGQYLATLGISATILGAVSLQLKNLATFKDPESMDTPEFWLKSFIAGGAGGMFADQFKTALRTRTSSDALTALSPTAGLGFDIASLTMGNLGQAAEGEKTNFGREAVKFGRKYALPQTWYTREATNRLWWDTLQKGVDPDAAGAFYRTEQRARKDTDVGMWWKPGQTSPSRAPDMGNAVKQKGLVKALSLGAIE